MAVLWASVMLAMLSAITEKWQVLNSRPDGAACQGSRLARLNVLDGSYEWLGPYSALVPRPGALVLYSVPTFRSQMPRPFEKRKQLYWLETHCLLTGSVSPGRSIPPTSANFVFVAIDTSTVYAQGGLRALLLDFAARTALSSPYRVPEYPLQGPLRGLSCPAVVHSFASYKKIVGELRRGESISHAFPSEAEAGPLALLEFSWPWPAEGAEASAVRLAASGDWMATGAGEVVGCMIIDMPADAAPALSLPDLSAFGGTPFVEEDPGLFPLASEVCRLAREWATDVLQEARSGYQTAVEEPVLAPRAPKARAKRHTVATLAQEQAALQDLVRGLAKQLATLLPPPAGRNSLDDQGPAAGAPPGLGPLPVTPAPALAAPLASILPPAQHVPKALSQVIGPPPPTRQQPKVPSPTFDHEAQLALITGEGDVPPATLGDSQPSSLAAAVLAQSNALVSLLGKLAQGSAEPMTLDAPSSTSVRGALGRQKLQQELLSSPGAMARRIRQNAALRTLALLAWITAQAADHLAQGSAETAADLLSLMLLSIDQANLDGGDMSFAWILSLQADPPSALYQEPHGPVAPTARAFSQLADQRWITIGLSFLKEIEAISSRRSELANPKKPSAPSLVTPTLPPKLTAEGEAALSKKQARAAAWAAKRAAAGKGS
ncbi:hypothetical protein AK812_SmicGene14783 [Symbiodinium microadriaticum]|uniref:Uncharacterized protein n=1 Tax=Symbiodinium microadriaticum TaxID=2951 RepID=A0A1Q9E4N7_SYMMI|nr:hypothetical protein AK812_SmicGene14783 [Symbiodinium microadriaticum]